MDRGDVAHQLAVGSDSATLGPVDQDLATLRGSLVPILSGVAPGLIEPLRHRLRHVMSLTSGARSHETDDCVVDDLGRTGGHEATTAERLIDSGPASFGDLHEER